MQPNQVVHQYKSPALRKVGRPTKVTPRMVRRAKEYIKNWHKDDKVIPTVEGLALSLKLSPDTIYQHEEFSETLRELRSTQAAILLNKGLEGKFNPVITKLILSSKHDYVERTKVDTTNLTLEVTPDAQAVANFAKFLASQ